MANPYFHFKQFTVHQAQTAMKVCTDACVLGTWAANDKSIQNAESILDIGTGTGLLSLMIAQKTNAHITAVEIEPNAFKEASSNIAQSPWPDQIQVIQNSIQAFTSDTNTSFSCVISNPPFFEGDLKSPQNEKNLASHSVALPWEILVQNVSALLKEEGIYFVLIPTLRSYTMQKLCASNGLQLMEEVLVYNDAKHIPFRALQKFIKSDTPIGQPMRNKLVIKKEDNLYSDAFIDLLKDYYLHL
jgi:tRNA1Val (adenine37-N6)-methyltransferase